MCRTSRRRVLRIAGNFVILPPMKFEVGDKVVIQHSNDEGEVVEIINDKMVLVDVRGVRFPAYTDQLDFPYFKRFTEKKLFPPEKKPKKYIDQLPPEKPQPGRKKELVAQLADGRSEERRV